VPAALVTNYASSASGDPHVISLAGKTVGRDIFILFACQATPTLPSPWVEEGSHLGGSGSFYIKLWRLPAVENTSGVTQISIDLNGSVSLAAVVWEDDLDGTTPGLVFEPVDQAANTADPALWGTGLHTYTTRDVGFAFYVRFDEGSTPSTFDLVSYDHSYAEFGDSGGASGLKASHVWLATLPDASLSSDGITATADQVRGSYDQMATGIFAYNQGAGLPPDPLLSVSPLTLTFDMEEGGATPADQTVSVTNGGLGGTVAWDASEDVPWLSITPIDGTAPSLITVSVDPTGMGVGSYTTDIQVTSDVAGSPKNITVHLNINAPPLEAAGVDLVKRFRSISGEWRRMIELPDRCTTPELHGARGDGKLITDAAITTGTDVLTSASAGFTAADVGKWISVRGAGLTLQGGSLTAQIESVTSETQVVLTVNAAATVSGAVARYGTDDTEAFAQAVEDLVLTGVSDGSYFGRLIISPKHYILAGAPTLGGATMGNSQIPIPYVDTDGPKFVLSFQGPGDGSHFYHWRQNAIRGGAVLHSFLLNQSIDPTYGVPSILGGPTDLPDEPDSTAAFSNMLVHIDGISFLAPRNPTLIGVDLGLIAQANIGTLSINADGTPVGNNLRDSATSDQGMALRMPHFQNNDNTNVFSFASEGFFYGIQISDHFTAQRLAIIYADTAIYCAVSGTEQHGANIGYISVEATNNGLECNGSPGGKYPIWIGRMDIEVSGSGTTIIDQDDCLYGELHYAHNQSDPPTVDGAANLKIIDDNVSPGAATSPSVPASTTPLANPFYRDAAVHVAGGTVSAISVDGQNVGVTSGLVIVPSGKSITLAYSSAPTWKWTLL